MNPNPVSPIAIAFILLLVLAVGPVATAAVPITVHSQGLPSAVSQSGISGSPLFSNNGKTVYYLSDGLNIGNHSAEAGLLNLYRYDYGSGITEVFSHLALKKKH